MVMYHIVSSGGRSVRIHCEDVPRMVQPLCAGCVKDDSYEIIKRYSCEDLCN